MVKTVKGSTYEVHDPNLASEGRKRVEWAGRHMPVLQTIRQRFAKEKPLKGVRVGACLHVTKETGQLMLTLKAAGAELFLCASNPLSTQDDVAAFLIEEGIHTYAWKFMDTEGYYRSIGNVLKWKTQVTIDDGADLVGILHKLARGEGGEDIDFVKQVLKEAKVDGSTLINEVWAGAEETTTGIIRLRAMAEDKALKYPIFATNDAPTKWEIDNVYGTGQSSIDGILRASEIFLAGKIFVVAGYGHCGRGVATRASGMGCRRIIVTEIDPMRAFIATLDGFEVMPMREAAPLGDIFITATGCKDILTKEHFQLMKDGAIVCNTGHFDCEINVKDIEKVAVKKTSTSPLVDNYKMENGRIVTVLAQGRLVNLSCAGGHPPEVMQCSFGNQALIAEYIAINHVDIVSKGGVVLPIPTNIDDKVVNLALKAWNVSIDKLTSEQQKYLTSWKEGTT